MKNLDHTYFLSLMVDYNLFENAQSQCENVWEFRQKVKFYIKHYIILHPIKNFKKDAKEWNRETPELFSLGWCGETEQTPIQNVEVFKKNGLYTLLSDPSLQKRQKINK